VLAAALAWVGALAVAFLLTPAVRALARRCDVLDRPDRRRKRHRRLVPLWGGLAVLPALAAGVALALAGTPAGQGLQARWQELGAGGAALLLAAAGLLAGAGIADDAWHLPPKVKLLCQLTAAVLVASAGLRFEAVALPGAAPAALWPLAGALAAVLWLTLVTNAFNFMDGLDGLASGQAVIAGAGLALAALLLALGLGPGARAQAELAAVLAAAASGAALGFWRYNREPASIFLGDAGSTLLGFTLALAAVVAVARAPRSAAPLVPLLVLGWPLADTLLAVGRRWRRGDPISKADHAHLHHRLLAQGFTPGAAVALILTAAGVLAAFGLAVAWL
jgi:UDP-GlcNAc:undecaprenyl-phosphate/decaprenyl-phosphate GlcNAc-1-phosphate transferase